MKNTYKNHVFVCLDVSSSMAPIIKTASDIFNLQIDNLRQSSIEQEQETRISFYTFASDVKCVISDVDVARPVKLEEITAYGNTALRDAFCLAINDAKELPQKYGDHSFIIYLITDGEENHSKTKPIELINQLKTLPDNFTVAAFVPNQAGVMALKNLGIPEGNIEIWNATKEGVVEVGNKFKQTMDNFFTARKSGVKSTRSIFSNLSEVTSKNVSKVLDIVKDGSYDVIINEDVKAVQIKPLVEKKLGTKYVLGNSFYELVKNEHVQPQKEIAVQNKKNGKVYTGDNARTLLNLPNSEVKITPEDHGEWIVFIQSTSVNRNVIPKQRVLVMK
jgi:uncharacterized protein YegL